MTYFEESRIKATDSNSIDAFGRWRISNPTTLFDSKQIFDDSDLANSVENYPLFFDNQELSGSGTSTTFNPNSASTSLLVSLNTAGGAAGSAGDGINNAIRLGALIDGTRDEIVLCARPIGGSTNVDIEGLLTWRELS